MANLADVQKRLEANDATYGMRFAGQSRLTRDLDLLDDLIATAQKLVTEANALPDKPAARKELVTEAERQLELYRSERTLIAQLRQQGGQAAVAASQLGTRANIVFHRYARHFAGQSRSTRDGSVMADMIEQLRTIQSEMQALAQKAPGLQQVKDDLKVVAGRLQQFEEERRNIGTAQSDGPSEQQASSLAGVANSLFAQYRGNFADLPRDTRRPERLVRMIEALVQVGERMKALQQQGLADEHNDRNIGIVAERLAAWQSELAAIRAERQKATVSSLESDLGTAANAEFESYGAHFAGKERKTRDLNKLRDIIDRLDDVERQMHRLDEVHGRPANQRNLGIVRDTLVTYLDEWEQIETAQAK